MPAPSLIQIVAESDMTCNFKVKERNHHTNMITFKREFFSFETLYYKFGFNLQCVWSVDIALTSASPK